MASVKIDTVLKSYGGLVYTRVWRSLTTDLPTNSSEVPRSWATTESQTNRSPGWM